MTIYRLNRVPDKLHVALLDLLGIRLDGPTAAHHRPALPARAPRRPSRSRSPAARPRSARRARATEESIVFQVDEDFTIPPVRPAAYVRRSAAASSRTSASPTATARPQGADQLAVRHARRRSATRSTSASRSRSARLLHAGRRRRLAGARRGRRTRRTRRCAGRSPQGDGDWAEAEVLEDLTGGFNYGSGHRRAAAAAAQRRSSRSAATGCTGCAAGSTTRRARGGAAPTYTHPPEIYSITAAPIGALLAVHARVARRGASCSALSDGTPGQIFPLRHTPGAQAGPGETLEVQDPESGDWSTLGAARGLRRLDRVRPPLRARPGLAARSSSARRSARPTAAGRQYGAVPPKGAVLRFTPLPPRRRPRGNVTARTR